MKTTGNTTLALLYLVLLAFACSAPSLAAPKAKELLEKLYEPPKIINNYQADIIVMKQDPAYLEKLFPEAKKASGAVPYKGKVSFYRPNYFNLMLELSTDRKMELVSDDGVRMMLREPFTVSYPVESSPSPSPTPSPSLSPGATPSPAAAVSPSPSPSPTGNGVVFVPDKTLTQTPSATPMIANTETFRGDLTSQMHAINLVFPYDLKAQIPENYTSVAGTEKVYNEDCYVLDISTTARGEMTLWLNKKYNYIMKLQYSDPETNKPIDAYYKNFTTYNKDGKTFYFAQSMEVMLDGRIIYSAEITKFDINIDTTKIFGYVDPSKMWKFGESKFRYGKKLRIQRVETPLEKVIFLSPILSTFVIFLLAGLGYYGYRYIKFVTTRKLFKREELIVVEGPEGRTTKALETLGFKAVPFTSELISEERKLLTRKKGMELPRAIIIENEMSANIKNHLYLIKAYVEEGGRVLLLPHSIESTASMPVAPSFIPLKKFDEEVFFTVKSNIWKKTKVAELEKNIYPFGVTQIYFKVNGRDVDKAMITAYNKLSGVTGAIVGSFREGKGEYLLCQLDILKTIESQYVVFLAKTVLSDMLSFLQGYEEEQPSPAKMRAKAKTTEPPPPVPASK